MIKPYHKVFPTSSFIVLYGEDFDGDNPFSLQQFCFAVFVLFINNNISIKYSFELDNLMLHECNFTT